MLSIRSKFVCAVATGAVSLGIAAAPATASHTNQDGLVNVSASEVNVPIGVAANVCNVSASVLSQAIGSPSGVGDCDAVAAPTADSDRNGHTRQRGLVNISLSDVNIPIGVAANVCNVSINVLSSAIGSPSGAGECDAIAEPTASS